MDPQKVFSLHFGWQFGRRLATPFRSIRTADGQLFLAKQIRKLPLKVFVR